MADSADSATREGRGSTQAGLALYRKYRPATFAEVRGQEHVTAPLRQALKSGRINHAYLFSGPRGCGKTSSARILARSLNCVNGPTPDPCGTCDSCVALAPSGPGSIDVIEIDAASHGGVDDARDLRERAFYSPVSGRYKIYIIDEAHMVTSQGFNALLKLVEEPPPHLKFIFATTEPEKVIPTIRSRTHHYPFRLMPPSVMRDLAEQILNSEHVGFDPAVLPLVVRAGGGSARDTLSILDQLLAGSDESGIGYDRAVALLGYTDATLIDEIVDAFASADGAAVFRAVNKVIEGGHEPRRFASDLLDRFRDLIVVASVPDAIGSGLIEVPPDRVEVMTGQASRAGLAQLTRAAEIINAGLDQMRGATSPRLLLELMCAQVLLPGAATDERSVLARLERLESGLGRMSAAPQPSHVPAAPAVPQASHVPAAPAVPQPSHVPAAPEPAVTVPAATVPSPPAPAASVPSPPAPVPPVSAPAMPAFVPAGTPAAPGAPPAAQPAHESAPPAQPTQPTQPQQAPAQQAPAQQWPFQQPSYAGPFQSAPQAQQAPPAPRGTVTTEMVQQGWESVLQTLRAKRRVAWILLKDAAVVSLDEAVLTLRFPRAGDVKGFTSSVHEGLLKEVLNERFSINVVIRAISGGDPGPGARGRGGPEFGAQPGQPPGPQFQPQPPAPYQQPPAPPAQAVASPAPVQQDPAPPVRPTQQQAPTHSPSPQAPQPPVALQSQPYSAPSAVPDTAPHSAAVQNLAVLSPAQQPAVPQFQGPPAQSPATPPVVAYNAAAATSPAPASSMAPAMGAGAAQGAPSMTQNGVGRTSNHVSLGDDVPFPSDDDFDGDEIAGSVDMDAGSQLTGISLIQRDLGAEIIAEYEE
jgi:DNA polymerase-3 subunit gamma/tau